MCFLRLAGCSVGCPECDTDYSVKSRHDPRELSFRVLEKIHSEVKDKWVWITGGEPTDRDLVPLIRQLQDRGLSVAVATSGHRRFTPTVDWLSVSPHQVEGFSQTYGHEIKGVAYDDLKWLVEKVRELQDPDKTLERVQTILGLSIGQINELRRSYIERTGKDPRDIKAYPGL